MSDLKTLLTSIKSEKDAKLIPENIRKDITIFNITGTYEAGLSPQEVTQAEEQIADLFGEEEE